MKSRFYDLQHIKAIPIADYLHACGIEPAKRYNGYALYHAPSSFHRGAHIEQIRVEQRPSNARRILSISEALPLHLQNYLREVRKIDLAVANPYLRHVCYEVGGREYSAIGFANRARGYELRDDKTFKGTIAPKDISVVAGEANNAPLCIFEGFMDFLSYLTMKGKETAPCLVLNSVSNLSRAVAYLHEKSIDSVRAFLDNDEAGRKACLALQSSGIKVEDMSRHYSRYKDLNEYHVAQCKQQQEVQQRKPVIVKHKIR